MQQHPDVRIADAARRNEGVFHRSTARDLGLSNRQIRDRTASGIWVEVLPRVYRFAATPTTPALLRRAALLWGGTGAALSHQTAGELWRLDGVRSSDTHVTVTRAHSTRATAVKVHSSTAFATTETVQLGALRCTSLARTLIDLGTCLNEEQLETALESARRIHRLKVPWLREHIDEIRRPGAGRLRRAIDALDPGPACESVFEVKVARRLRRSGLLVPIRQYVVETGGARYRLDFAWPQFKIGLECDGRAYHEFQRDRTRWRALATAGWKVLPVTWQDVTENWGSIEMQLRSVVKSAV